LCRQLAEARTRRTAGDYPAAAGCLRRAVAEVENALGPDAVELVVTLNELGIVSKYSGNFDDAERAYRRALLIREHHGLADNADVAAILHNLGGLAHARGDAETAEPLARHGIAVRLSTGDADPLAMAADRAALAAILIDLDRLDEAHDLLTGVLAVYERELGPDHYETAVTLHNLGSLQFREAAFADATATLQRAYELKMTTLGHQHPDLAITMYNLACCQQQLGQRRAARRLLTRAIEILTPAVAPTNPTLSACRQKLGSPGLR
jgi:tetratricopeptide (TPR) repeat protein